MKPLFKQREKAIELPFDKTQKYKPIQYSIIALGLAISQIPLSGIFPNQKAVAQTSCPAGTTATTVNWQPAVGAPAIAAQNIDADGVGVRLSFTESIPGQVIENDLIPFGGEVYGTRIDNDVYGGFPGPNLRLHIGIGKQPSPGSATLTLTFDRPVTFAAPLTLLDVDRDGERDGGFTFQDRVTVNAFNGNNPVGVTLRSLGNNNRVNGNTVAGINENSFPGRGDGNAAVTINEPVTSVRFLYEPGTEYGPPLQDQTVGLAQFQICTPVPLGSIGDTVYNDLNGNSRQDEGEPGLPGVALNLIGAGEDNQFGTADDITQTTTSNDNGNYRFSELLPGQYQVSVPNPPEGFSPTQVFDDTVNLTAGQEFNDADFGFRQQSGSIGDEVFIDTNGNGTREESEAGLPNAILILRDRNGQEIGRTTTNDNGIYGFSGLELGDYSVEVLRPDDFTPTTETTISASLTPTNPSTTSVDFGLRPNQVGAGDTPNIRVVKRITNAFRNGQPLPVANFNSFNPDPNSDNDDSLPGQERFVGVPRIETLLQSGDEVEYTIYFLTEGEEPLRNTRFCDLVPEGTTFVNNSITVNGAGSDAQAPQFFTPLAPVDNFTDVCGGNNTNGAVVNNLGTIPANTFGFVRFRVGIN